MCLGIPMKIVELREPNVALVERRGIKRTARLDLLPEAKVGDFVLVHAGLAISRITAEDAAETEHYLRQAEAQYE